MIHRDRGNREELLLDFHLNRLDDHDRSWIERELLRDPELRARSDRLGKILRPLDHWTVGSAPANLVDRVLESIRATSPPRASGYAAPSEPERYRPGPTISLRQVLAIAACIVLLVSVSVPGLTTLRDRSRRAVCASNLGSIFRGTSLYQQAFAGSLPFAGSRQGVSWLPGGPATAPFESNSRHIYLINRLNYGPKPEHFICPACKSDGPMRADELANYTDFAGARNISYASLNLAGASPNLRPPATIAYLSDPSPLFVNARFDPTVDPSRANSRAHKGKGQRVLTLDGSVSRLTSPVYGIRRDNLWLAGEIRHYYGTETPTGKDDAFLIPGYPSTDLLIGQSPLR